MREWDEAAHIGLASVALAGLVLGLAVGAKAQTPAASALLRQHASLEAELRRPDSTVRERRLTRRLDRALDYDMIVHRVLVVHWGSLTDAQRERATGLLTRAIRHRYRRSVQALSGWDVEVISESPQGVGRRVVTRASHVDESRAISYDLYRAERTWRVVDFIVEGESIVHQYRMQFNRLIRREGWDGFIRRLEDRVAEDDA